MTISYQRFKQQLTEGPEKSIYNANRKIYNEIVNIHKLIIRTIGQKTSLDVTEISKRLNRLARYVHQSSTADQINFDGRLYKRNHALRVLAHRLKAAERLNIKKAVRELS